MRGSANDAMGEPANNSEGELEGRLSSAGAAFGKLWCRGSTEDPRCGGRGWSRRRRSCSPATNRYLVWRVPHGTKAVSSARHRPDPSRAFVASCDEPRRRSYRPFEELAPGRHRPCKIATSAAVSGKNWFLFDANSEGRHGAGRPHMRVVGSRLCTSPST
jgi:hypothetical protein